ncbi:MAG TPA: tRNA dihydrouridine synthase DusB [Chromatiales bacterium]|nr:tRNA dihydrouridine synthase DusB [Thiotrichales bacterium]HIP68829.1 tRNA dihydrouridine synthase DusB [Chromatiales bacterium]
MKIGPYSLENKLILAPMAGVTDQPFRALCRRLGAGMTVSEMMTADSTLWHTDKSRLRQIHQDEPAPRSVQIAGTEPRQMATAAQLNMQQGAQIIDINMGCPAKKVCRKAAGAALLRDEKLVGEILESVVNAVDIPVTLKIRTGWNRQQKNGLQIARIAENAGVQAIAIHGRTREDKYLGKAEYDSIAAIKQAVSIPVIANGDIDSPEKAEAVLKYTQADALMIGRAAQGNPWIFREIDHYLKTGSPLPAPTAEEKQFVITQHLQALHQFYGETRGVRIARKHLGWYFNGQPDYAKERKLINQAETAKLQLSIIRCLFIQNTNEANTDREEMAA